LGYPILDDVIILMARVKGNSLKGFFEYSYSKQSHGPLGMGNIAISLVIWLVVII
jgi:hypothetical protein